MARDGVVQYALLGVLGYAGLQLAQQGAFGAKAQAWAGSFKAGFKSGFKTSGAGAGQSQSSGTTGGSPAQQAAAPPQNQQQPSSTVAIRDNNSPGYPGNAPAGPAIIANFVATYQLDPSDHTADWVNYYRQQFGSWPDEDLAAVQIQPYDLYVYAVNAIGFLTGGPTSGSGGGGGGGARVM